MSKLEANHCIQDMCIKPPAAKPLAIKFKQALGKWLEVMTNPKATDEEKVNAVANVEATADALCASHTAQESRGEWQPIETAPKDGRRILTINLGDEPDYDPVPISALWWKPNGPLETGDWFIPGSAHEVDGCVVLNRAYMFDPPTHWKPLDAVTLPPVPQTVNVEEER